MPNNRLRPVIHFHKKLKSLISLPTLQTLTKTSLPALKSSTEKFKTHKTTVQKCHQKIIPPARANTILKIKTKLSPINVQELSFFDSFELKELVELIK